MGGKSGGDTTQRAVPWGPQQPYLRQGFEQAQGNLQNPQQFYPNPTYVPFSQQTEQGLGMLEGRAQNNPLTPATQGYVTGALSGNQPGQQALTDSAQGNFLNANPYLDAMFGEASRNVTDRFNETIAPNINATFGKAGRTGSPAHELVTGRAAGDLSDSLAGMAANIYGGNYMQERQNQLGAARDLTGNAYRASTTAPLANQLAMGDISSMLDVGGAVEGMAGNVLQDSMSRFNFGQQQPDDALARYISAIQGNYGGTTSTDVAGNPIAGGLGGALVGNQIGGNIGSGYGGWGTLIGALLGGLSS